MRVRARAIAPDGHVWSLNPGEVRDETADARYALRPADMVCPRRGAFALSFSEDGSVFAIADGRLYVRAPGHDFAPTPMCGDLGPAAASRWRGGGYGFVSNGRPTGEPSLLLTRHPEGAIGWYAITALDPTMRAVVLDPQRSMLTLNARGQLVVVDQVNTVAGAVLAAGAESFAGLSRTEEAALAWRDDGPTARVLVWGHRLDGAFTRVASQRPPGAATRYVAMLDLARFVAVTDAGVELSADGGQRFARVLAADAPRVDLAGGAAAGWIAEEPAVAFPAGVARARCEGFPGDAGLR